MKPELHEIVDEIICKAGSSDASDAVLEAAAEMIAELRERPRYIESSDELIELARSLRSKWDTDSEVDRVATLIGMAQIIVCSNHTMAEAISEVVPPEHREFWLRVEATIEERFRNGIMAMFSKDLE